MIPDHSLSMVYFKEKYTAKVQHFGGGGGGGGGGVQ